MSSIYIHYTDKTLVLDSSENLIYPMLGSLLKWDNLRVAFAISLTQSLSDNNAGFGNDEALPIINGLPILNRLSFGLKNRGLELPGEAGCSFCGYSNPNGSNGSSVGTVDGTILTSTADMYTFNVNLQNPGGVGYSVDSSPLVVPLNGVYSASGTAKILQVGQPVLFNGKTTFLQAPLSDGQNTVTLNAASPLIISPSELNGTARSDLIQVNTSLGGSIGSSHSYSTTSSLGHALQFPASFVMQGSSNYSTIVVMDYVVTNRGTSSQQVKVGYQVIPNEGDTSVPNMEAKISAYLPTYESSFIGFNTTMPTCFFIRWPFATTRLRLHSLVIKRV